MSQTIYKSLAIISAFGIGLSVPAAGAQEMSMDQGSGKMQMDKSSGQMKQNPDKMKPRMKSRAEPMKMPAMQGGSAPADARDPYAYSDGFKYRGIAGFEKTDIMKINKVIADQFEYRSNKGGDTFNWDTQGWRGSDYNKLWVKFEGQKNIAGSEGEMKLQALYSRAVTAFWDFQVGARYDTAFGNGAPGDRVFAVIGFQGLAPYWFEMEPAIFVSDKGDVSARFAVSYELLFTQRLILQPRFEANIAANAVREYEIGSGLNDIRLDLRLRYEVRRKFAPYVGLSWSRKFGDTANMVRARGGDVNSLSFVTGVRFWF